MVPLEAGDKRDPSAMRGSMRADGVLESCTAALAMHCVIQRCMAAAPADRPHTHASSEQLQRLTAI